MSVDVVSLKITLALQKATNKQIQEKETLFSSRDIFVGFAVGKKIRLCFAIFRHVTRKKQKYNKRDCFWVTIIFVGSISYFLFYLIKILKNRTFLKLEPQSGRR